MTWDANVKEMADTWTDVQKQIWAFWLGTTTEEAANQPWVQCYNQSLEISEAMVNLMVDTQSSMSRLFLKSINPGDTAPPLVTQYFEQLESMTENWNEALRKVSNSWFTAIKDLDKMRKSGALPEPDNIFKTWQDATERTLAIQSEWAAQLMPGTTHAGKTAGSKGKEPAPPKKQGAPNTAKKAAP